MNPALFDIGAWLLEREIQLWGMDMVSADHPGTFPIGLPKLQYKRLIPDAIPWKFKGGRAAFGRAVTFGGA